MLNLRVVSNSEVDSNMLNDLLEFDRKIFPIEENYSFPDGYLEKLYEKYKDGLFVLLDNDNIVGYVNCIFLSDEIEEAYLKNKRLFSIRKYRLSNWRQ